MHGAEYTPEHQAATTHHFDVELDTCLANALSHASVALLVTDIDGTIRRASCPLPKGIERISNSLRGKHINAPFMMDERHFINGLLQKGGRSGSFSARNLPVSLNGECDRPIYLSVSTIKGSKHATTLISWRFTTTEQADSTERTDRERLLNQIKALEARAKTHHKSAEHARNVLAALAKTNHSLTGTLQASQMMRRQQSEYIRQTIAAKDEQLRRERELHAATREARKSAEDARKRLGLLADSSWALAGSLDMDATLQRISNLIVPGLSDCCVIDLLDTETHTLRHATVACDDAEVRRRVEMFPVTAFRDAEAGHPMRHAMLSQHAAVVHNLGGTTDYEPIDPPCFLDRAADIGLTACIVAPLRSRDRVFGTLTLASTRQDHRYRPEDLRFVEDLALRAAQALDNAKLFHETEEAVKDRERYLAMASHELRSPLAVISGFGSLLLRFVDGPDLDREKVASVGNEMLRGIERLEMLTSNLLMSASVRADSAEGQQRNSVDIETLMTKLLERMDVTIGRREQDRVQVQCPPSLHGIWNAEAIERAIANVLSNALKYSSEDSKVTVVVEQDEDNAVIGIRDQGIGMTSEELSDLFTPFARGQMARKTASGTGLGLYITKQIVTQHGGRIDVESEAGAGTLFTITLPLVPHESTGDST